MASQGPRRGRQRLTQTSEEPKNAWRPARGLPGPPLPMSHGAPGQRGRHLQRRPPHLRGHQSGGAVGSENRSSPPPTPPARKHSEVDPTQDQRSTGMATASTSGQSAFGLGRKKKSPGLMDQISTLFGGDKKKRSKVG